MNRVLFGSVFFLPEEAFSQHKHVALPACARYVSETFRDCEIALRYLIVPGADDDGSGSVTILESYRALISSNFRPVRPVEFHWYAAEVHNFASAS